LDFWLRGAAGEDREFLADMLVLAVNWSAEWKPEERVMIASGNAMRLFRLAGAAAVR
jgi:hypothetical protein